MAKKRNVARPGLSYLDANSGRLVTIENDVLGIKQKIQELWPEVNVYFDVELEKWVLTEMCKDGTERLIFETAFLNELVIDRLHQAQEDPMAAMDRIEKETKAEEDRKFHDQMGDTAERLAWAFARDGLTVRPRVSMHIPNRERTKRRATVRG